MVSCDQSPDIPPIADFEVPPLRNTMFEIDALNRAIEPILRDETQTQTVASTALSMQRWVNDGSWGLYMAAPEFFGDPEQFSEYLSWLQAGTNQLVEAAEAGDLTGIRNGFIRAQQSCTACHKRFQHNI